MNTLKYIYLGGFPPPYGGVTIKNKQLYDVLKLDIDIKQSYFYSENSNNISRTIFLLRELLSKETVFIIGLSMGSLNLITNVLYLFNKNLMKRSIVMVMGGAFPEYVKGRRGFSEKLAHFKRLYVETEGMANKLNCLGVNNTAIFPNCRKPNQSNSLKEINKEKIKCLYFSQISEEKGADIVIEAARILNEKNINYSIDFYGHIKDSFSMQFFLEISNNDNLRYLGVYKNSIETELYSKLSEYDILVFPTRWKNEGVPGILVEAKMAGIVSIVSDINYNAEIVKHNETGYVLKNNTAEDLSNAIIELSSDSEKLIQLKKKSKLSGDYYILENYIEDLMEDLRNESSLFGKTSKSREKL